MVVLHRDGGGVDVHRATRTAEGHRRAGCPDTGVVDRTLLIDLTIAVVVDLIAALFIKVRRARGIVVIAVTADARAVAVAVRIIFGERVAVVVEPVTGDLGHPRADLRGGVVAVHAARESIAIEVGFVCGGVVAVVINAIAEELGGIGVDEAVVVVAVHAAVVAVAVDVLSIDRGRVAVLVDVGAVQLDCARIDGGIAVIAVEVLDRVGVDAVGVGAIIEAIPVAIEGLVHHGFTRLLLPIAPRLLGDLDVRSTCSEEGQAHQNVAFFGSQNAHRSLPV